MTDKELLYIRTVAKERSVSKAAQKLFITQPSLSQCIQRIESALGTRLFTRTSSGLILTYAGERYCQIAGEILRIYSDYELEVSDINNLKKGRVTIGITTYLATYFLPVILPAFHRNYPHIEVYVLEETSTQLEKDLASGQLDFALAHLSPPPEDLPASGVTFLPLHQDPFVLTAPPGHPLCRDAIRYPGEEFPRVDLMRFAQEPFVMVTRGQRIRKISDMILGRAQLNPPIVLSTKSFETARRLAARGMGVTFTPRQYLDIFGSQDPGEYYCIDPSYNPYWTLGIAVPKNGYLSRAARSLIEQICQRFAEPSSASNLLAHPSWKTLFHDEGGTSG